MQRPRAVARPPSLTLPARGEGTRRVWGTVMNRTKLLALQILVAIVSIPIWHFFSTYPLSALAHLGFENNCVTVLPPFFFSTPYEVAARVVKWFVDGSIWKHLWITLVEAMLAFLVGSLAGVLVGFWFARKPMVNSIFDPYVKML